MRTLYRSVMATLVLGLILCGAYPLAVYAVAQVFFRDQAGGGIVLRDGKPVGARLIGQGFSKPEYFHPRPSSAGDKGYDAENSSGSNLGPTNQKFYDALKGNVEAFLKDNPSARKGSVPTDAVTASGSGLDPHITPENAYAQAERVAGARKVPTAVVRELIARHIEGPQWGIFGEPVVNVLLVNLELDERMPAASK